MSEREGTETSGGERKLTLVIDDDALFENGSGLAPAESGDLLDIATALAQKKWFIAKVTAVVGLLGLVVVLQLPEWYTAETKILPPQQPQSSAAALLNSLSGTSGLGALASAGKDLGIKNPNDLYVGMLKTRPVTDAIMRRFDLQKVYGAKDGYAARKKLIDHTEIASTKEGFISVSVEDKNKKRAAEMANGYVDELRNLNWKLAITEASQRRLFYEQQLKQAKDDLADAEIALKLEQQKSGVIELGSQARAMIENVGRLRAEIAAREARLQAVRSFATERNSEVDMLQRELASLRTELRHLVRQGGDSENYDVPLKDVPAAGVEYIRAERDVKYRAALFEVLVKQYEAAKLDEAKDAPIIQVVEPAIEPERRSWPRRTFVVVVSTFLGLFLAVLLTLLNRWKDSIQMDPRQMERFRAFQSAVSFR